MFNRSRSLLAGLMAALSIGSPVTTVQPASSAHYRGPTRSRKGGRNKNGLPRLYPGAKLARKAMQGKIGIRH